MRFSGKKEGQLAENLEKPVWLVTERAFFLIKFCKVGEIKFNLL